MNIKELLDGSINSIDIDEEFTIPKENYANTEIIDLEEVKVTGNLTYPSDDNIFLDVECSGTMKLTDSVSLEPINYPFSFKISHFMGKYSTRDPYSL